MIAPLGRFINGTIIRLPISEKGASFKYGIIMNCIGDHSDVIVLTDSVNHGEQYVNIVDCTLATLPKNNYYANCGTVYKVMNSMTVEKVGVLARTDWAHCLEKYDYLNLNNRISNIVLS